MEMKPPFLHLLPETHDYPPNKASLANKTAPSTQYIVEIVIEQFENWNTLISPTFSWRIPFLSAPH